ncbi:MAG TPA: hypothetical protein VH187_05500 [Scandinavium sp.]|jgi:hypothetical protein|uniref:hypothetical protein n=1 Tax=Scandinavium sp. TaxID=2830653 RepID=UPI002E3543DD|nr:hypothetical protein [Scandinavium sp.]HEX4500616.1 hypothetical protein [Scandinavium sp.]
MLAIDRVIDVKQLDFTKLDQELLDIDAGKARLIPLQPLQRIRDSHHWLARAIAMGKRHFEVAAETGYSISRISILLADPTFQNLVQMYRREFAEQDIEGHMDARQMLQQNFVKSLRLQSDLLDDYADAHEAGEKLPAGVILDNVVNLADRLGHGKTQTNVNVDANGLADRIEAARRAYLRSLGDSADPATRKPSHASASAGSPALLPEGDK